MRPELKQLHEDLKRLWAVSLFALAAAVVTPFLTALALILFSVL